MLIYEIDYGNIKNQVECEESLRAILLSFLLYRTYIRSRSPRLKVSGQTDQNAS